MCFSGTSLGNSTINPALGHLKPSATVIWKIYFHGQGFRHLCPTNKIPLGLAESSTGPGTTRASPQEPRWSSAPPPPPPQAYGAEAASALQRGPCRAP